MNLLHNLNPSPKVFFEHRWEHPKDYLSELTFMKECHQKVLNNHSKNIIILTRHNICRTCGILDTDLGDGWIKTNRGGGQTYHDPGQVLCYPIIRLSEFDINLGDYTVVLCKWLHKSLSDLVKQVKDLAIINNGLWFRSKKIAFIGTRVSQGVTMHGFSINFNTDLDSFAKISPCGQNNLPIGNLHCSMEEIIDSLISHCPFGMRL